MSKRASALICSGLAASAGLALASAAIGQPAPPNQVPTASRPSATERCAALISQRLDHTEILSASLIPENGKVAGASGMSMNGSPGPGISGLPAFCRVIAKSVPEPGSDIRFEVWLPADNWNGRFTGVGNGGYAGPIDYADMATAIKVGQASASTDTGHTGNGQQSEWAKGNPQKIRDYGWRAVHVMTAHAKALVSAFYGRPATSNIFMSCSNGGRQALMEASRFPEDYDGVIAGAPAARFTRLIMSMIWTVQAQQPPGAALRPDQAKFLQSEVLKQCDARDGQADGLVNDPRQCRFDPARLACGTSPAAQCFSPPQITALRRMLQGPSDSRGRPLAETYPVSGAEAGNPIPGLGWENWLMTGGAHQSANIMFPKGMLENFNTGLDPELAHWNWDRDPARFTAALGADLDAQPDMTRFFNRGGKLIIWHGWADAAIPPQHAISFYNDVLKQSGPRARTQMRLFLVPGMQHCFGGTGASIFGQFSPPSQDDSPDRNIALAMQHWVEQGRVPESFVTRRGFSMSGTYRPDEKQRLMCAYPKRARLTAGQDPDRAASYSCR